MPYFGPVIPFWGNLVRKITIVFFRWNLKPSLIQICWIFMVMFTYCFGFKMPPFLEQIWSKKAKLSVYKYTWCLGLFKMKVGTETNSYILNSMIVCLALNRKCFFFIKFGQKKSKLCIFYHVVWYWQNETDVKSWFEVIFTKSQIFLLYVIITRDIYINSFDYLQIFINTKLSIFHLIVIYVCLIKTGSISQF